MSTQATNILSHAGQGYHDYVVLILKTDAEWTRSLSSMRKSSWETSFINNQSNIYNACYKYADNVNRNYADFTEANKDYNSNIEKSDVLEYYLYHPMFFVPFGHADTLSICLFDDFEPTQSILSDIPTNIEDYCVGFSPVLESMPELASDCMCDLKTLFSSTARPNPVRESFCPPEHPLQIDMPLLLYTKYKIVGMAGLDNILLFQSAIFKAIRIKIANVLQTIKTNYDAHSSLHTLVEDREDLEHIRCSIIDIQGFEEIGTIILCRNYSIASICVAAISSLTFKDVYNADDTGMLKVLASYSATHKAIANIAPKTEANHNSDVHSLDDNHIFRWTHSTPAVTPSSFFQKQYTNCHGYIEAQTQLNVAPGHMQVTCDTIKHKHSNDIPINTDYHDYLSFQLGLGDMIVPILYDQSFSPLIRITYLLDVLATTIRTCHEKNGKEGGRHVVDISTQISVPIYDLRRYSDCAEYADLIYDHKINHYSYIVQVLRDIQKRLCLEKNNIYDGYTERISGRLNIQELKQKMRLCGIPKSLRVSIECLFQNYATIIADPFLYDTILDLYDTFATLHAVLTQHLPEKRKIELECTNDQPLGMLDSGRNQQLAMFVEAIQNAMSHRLAKGYMDTQIRDMSIDIKGSFNQVILAADAPLKCGIGLSRKYVLKHNHYDRICALTKIDYMPGARSVDLVLNVEDKAQLAYIEVDVPHILNVGCYIDYLHEAFHLIFDSLLHGLNNKDETETEVKTLNNISVVYKNQDSVLGERLSEIFALLMTHVYVYGDNSEMSKLLFIKTTLINYSSSYTTAGIDNFGAIIADGEMLIRLFFAYDVVSGDLYAQQAAINKIAWNSIKCGTKEVKARYQAFLKIAYPLLWISREKMNAPDNIALEYFEKYFEESYTETAMYMPAIWENVSLIYQKYAAKDKTSANNECESIDAQICECIKEGYSFYGLFINKDAATDKNNIISVDALQIICAALRGYCMIYCDINEKQMHLNRVTVSQRVCYTDSLQKREWFPFQIDKGTSMLFCPVPSARKMRLKMQISVIKTCWNISAILRSRRLMEIIKDNWYEKEYSCTV